MSSIPDSFLNQFCYNSGDQHVYIVVRVQTMLTLVATHVITQERLIHKSQPV